MDMNRRGFAKLLLGGVIGVAATPLLLLKDKVNPYIPKEYAKRLYDKAQSSFGWIEKDKITFTEVVTTTLKRNEHVIANNIVKNNPLYEKLTLLDVADSWQQEDIDRISAKLTERMNKRLY